MPFPPAPQGTVRAVFTFLLQGQECQIVQYHNVGLVDPSGNDLKAFANDLMQEFELAFEDVLTTELTLSNVVCTMVEAANGPQAESDRAPHSFAVNVPSVNNALAVQFYMTTGLSGRSFKGKMFVPGARSDNIAADSNYWSSTGTPPTYIDQLQTAGEAYLAGVNALTPVGTTANEWSVASYFSGTSGPPLFTPTPRAPDPAVITPITGIVVRPRIATQRRRRPRS